MAISNEELIAKARGAKSAEELLALAKENGVELTEEQANAYFEQMNKTGELEDDELDSVAGGGCHKKDGRLVVTIMYGCDYWRCEKCSGGFRILGQFGTWHDKCRGGYEGEADCQSCYYMSYEKGLWLCNNPKNRK